jgi:hypothetical protein
VAVKSLLKGIIISSLLLAAAVSAGAQTSLGNLVSQVRTAVVIVNTYDEGGNVLAQSSGFFVAPDLVLTNVRMNNSARLIRINTFSGKTILVQSVVGKAVDSDLTIMKLTQACLDVTPIKVKTISKVKESAIVLNDDEDAEWRVTPAFDGGWSVEHITTHLQIAASLDNTNGGRPIVKLKGHVNGTPVTVP